MEKPRSAYDLEKAMHRRFKHAIQACLGRAEHQTFIAQLGPKDCSGANEKLAWNRERRWPHGFIPSHRDVLLGWAFVRGFTYWELEKHRSQIIANPSKKLTVHCEPAGDLTGILYEIEHNVPNPLWLQRVLRAFWIEIPLEEIVQWLHCGLASEEDLLLAKQAEAARDAALKLERTLIFGHDSDHANSTSRASRGNAASSAPMRSVRDHTCARK